MDHWRRADQAALQEEARHPDTSPERLRELSALGPVLEAEVAAHPNTPGEVLERLAQHGKVHTWLGLLKNPRLPEVCFEALKKRGDHRINRALALCDNTPAGLREQLSRGDHLKTLQALARHPKTPPAILERLSSHRFTGVYRAALKNPMNLMYMEGEPWQRLMNDPWRITIGRPLPGLLLERFSLSNSYQRQRIAALCPSLSPQQLERLASSDAAWIRACIARHPKITEGVARSLSKDPVLSVSNSLLYNEAALLVLPSLAKKKR